MRRAPAWRARRPMLVEMIVCVAVLLVFAGVLLERLRCYQEAAEMAAMQYTVNT